MKKVLIAFLAFLFALPSFSQCPKKIKWKKLQTKEEVMNVLKACLPEKSTRLQVEEFLSVQKVTWSESTPGIIVAPVLTRSKSMWIEKKWAMHFMIAEDNTLKEIKVDEWLTGP